MQQYRKKFSSMGCPCEIRVYAERPSLARRAINAAIAEVERLDRKYSLYREDSVLARINGSAGMGFEIAVDEETAALLDYADQEYKLSDGLFDITAGALWRVWDFHAAGLPDTAAISRALEVTGWHRVQWQRPLLSLPVDGLALDLGGIAKEYAADRAATILQAYDIQHGLVDLGGDLSVAGPHPDARGWSIGIKDPEAPNTAIAVIDLVSGGLATSGDYERCLEVNGTRYGHILNPKTGWPVQGYASISVQASSCLAAGAISTVAMLKGKPGGGGFLKDCGLAYLSIGQNGLVMTKQSETVTNVTTNTDLPSPDGHLARGRTNRLGYHPV